MKVSKIRCQYDDFLPDFFTTRVFYPPRTHFHAMRNIRDTYTSFNKIEEVTFILNIRHLYVDAIYCVCTYIICLLLQMIFILIYLKSHVGFEETSYNRNIVI